MTFAAAVLRGALTMRGFSECGIFSCLPVYA
jgi:hypothetical protein